MSNDFLDRARNYYNQTAELYLEALGTVFQAGVIPGLDPDPYRSTMIHIKERAGVCEGMRILDAGCGVCGPSVHLCSLVPDLSVEAITVSEVQAKHAERLVDEAGFSDRIHITVGDYHNLSFADDSFDRVLFLESTGYSYDPPRLFAEVYRVLRPGGIVYIKDVFCLDGPRSFDELSELAIMDDIYAQATRPISFYVEQLKSANFEPICHNLLLKGISTDLMASAMWAEKYGRSSLTPFGERHYRPFKNLPLVFGEVIANK